MIDDESFIARWSRRKHRAARDVQAVKPGPAAESNATGVEDLNEAGAARACSSAAGASAKAPELAFDPASLPPIESITAASDIRPFLAPGVPPELSRAALRRVWTTDPAIRDFVGLSENAWDFNAPDTIAGFGSLEMTDEMRRQVARIIGGNHSPEESVASTSAPPAGQSAGAASESPMQSAVAPGDSHSEAPAVQRHTQDDGADEPNAPVETGRAVHAVAMQHDPPEPDNIPDTVKPMHGRALPK